DYSQPVYSWESPASICRSRRPETARANVWRRYGSLCDCLGGCNLRSLAFQSLSSAGVAQVNCCTWRSASFRALGAEKTRLGSSQATIDVEKVSTVGVLARMDVLPSRRGHVRLARVEVSRTGTTYGCESIVSKWRNCWRVEDRHSAGTDDGSPRLCRRRIHPAHWPIIGTSRTVPSFMPGPRNSVPIGAEAKLGSARLRVQADFIRSGCARVSRSSHRRRYSSTLHFA